MSWQRRIGFEVLLFTALYAAIGSPVSMWRTPLVGLVCVGFMYLGRPKVG